MERLELVKWIIMVIEKLWKAPNEWKIYHFPFFSLQTEICFHSKHQLRNMETFFYPLHLFFTEVLCMYTYMNMIYVLLSKIDSHIFFCSLLWSACNNNQFKSHSRNSKYRCLYVCDRPQLICVYIVKYINFTYLHFLQWLKPHD